MKVIGKVDFDENFENVEAAAAVYDFNSDKDAQVAVLPMKFATELLQMWFQQLHEVKDRIVIGQLQDSLRGCTIQQAMVITKSWLDKQNLIKAIASNDYSSYLVK